MSFDLPTLPYSKKALEPYISEKTLSYHYGKHHQAYVDKLNVLLEGTEFAHLELTEIIEKSQGAIFNNAAQHWNHSFYWQCLSPQGGGKPNQAFIKKIAQSFGSFDNFKKNFSEQACGLFGSGWMWLVENSEGKLELMATQNAATPMTSHKTPLLTCDVWEHAYYLDTQNSRPQYLENFWKLVDWKFVVQNVNHG